MKNTQSLLVFLFLLSFLRINGQELPILELRSAKNIKLPQKLEENEIGVVFEQFGGWSAYNKLSYYIFKNNSDIIVFNKETPKDYLKKNKKLKESITKIALTEKDKKQLREKLQSKLTSDFLKYSQVNFKNDKNSFSKCMISDAFGYKITFIQNGKENKYKYYAPKYYLYKCSDENINKAMLKKYIELIAMWQ